MIGKNTVCLVGSVKGGVGKSTLAVHLAQTRLFDRAGSVVLVDAEPGEGAVSVWADARASQKVTQIPVIKADSLNIYNLVKRLSKEFDNVVIDTPGHNSDILRAALSLADVLVVPFTNSTFGGWKTFEMPALIDEANESRRKDGFTEFRSLYVLNNFKSNATKKIASAKELLEESSMVYAQTVIKTRAVYDEVIAYGLTVSEFKTGLQAHHIPGEAIQEINALASEVFEDASHSKA